MVRPCPIVPPLQVVAPFSVMLPAPSRVTELAPDRLKALLNTPVVPIDMLPADSEKLAALVTL